MAMVARALGGALPFPFLFFDSALLLVRARWRSGAELLLEHVSPTANLRGHADGADCCGAARTSLIQSLGVCADASCIHLFTVMEYVWKQHARKININYIYTKIASLVRSLCGSVTIYAHRLASFGVPEFI